MCEYYYENFKRKKCWIAPGICCVYGSWVKTSSGYYEIHC